MVFHLTCTDTITWFQYNIEESILVFPLYQILSQIRHGAMTRMTTFSQPRSAGFPESYDTKTGADTLSKGIQKGGSLAVPGLKSSVRQTPLGVQINTATIWLLLHEGSRGAEKGRIGGRIIVQPGDTANATIHTQ